MNVQLKDIFYADEFIGQLVETCQQVYPPFDQDKFKELYETAERNTKLRKKSIKAIDLFSAFVQERKDTGIVKSRLFIIYLNKLKIF